MLKLMDKLDAVTKEKMWALKAKLSKPVKASSSECRELMKHDSYRRGKGGAVRQKH